MAISRVQKAAANSPGGSTTPAASFTTPPTAANLLIAYVAWNQDSAGTVTLGGVSAGWTLIPTDGDVSNAGNTHHAVYYKVAAAGEPSAFSATLSANRRWGVVLIEYGGFPGTPTLDRSGQATGSTTSTNTGTTATTSDPNELWLGFVSCKNIGTQTSPQNSFTAVEINATNPGAPASFDICYAALERVVSTVGAATSGTTISTSRVWVGTIATFTVGAVTFAVTVEAGFGYGPKEDPIWTDITSYVRSFTWQRGRQNELNQTQAGTGSMLLRDYNSHWDPDNSASPFYPNVKPAVAIRAYLTAGYTVYPLFRMYAERMPRAFRVTSAYTERQLDLIDGFALLAVAGLSGSSYASQLTSDRVSAVLDEIEWSATRRSIGTGATTIVAASFSDENETMAQQHLLDVNDTENGFIFVDGGGNLVFIGRHSFFIDPLYTTSQATFRDQAGSSGQPYKDLDPSYDLDQTFNVWKGKKEGGTVQVARDIESKRLFFKREKQFTSLATSDGEVLSQAQWKLGIFGYPLNRVESITMFPLADGTPARVAAGFSREIGQRITIKETPPGFAVETSDDYIIQQLNGEVTTGPVTTAKLTFMVWPVSAVQSFWVIGDASQSLAGISTRPGY